MSKRKFLLPVAVSVASLMATGLANIAEAKESLKIQVIEQPTVQDLQADDAEFVLTPPSSDGLEWRRHRSHSSHRSHRSHRSHYSSYR